MVDVGVQISNPLFLSRIVTEHLRAERPSVPVTFEGNYSRPPLPIFITVHAHKLERTLGRFGSGGEKKCLFELRRRRFDQILDIVRTYFRRKSIGVQ